jgi:hypothetical protein
MRIGTFGGVTWVREMCILIAHRQRLVALSFEDRLKQALEWDCLKEFLRREQLNHAMLVFATSSEMQINDLAASRDSREPLLLGEPRTVSSETSRRYLESLVGQVRIWLRVAKKKKNGVCPRRKIDSVGWLMRDRRYFGRCDWHILHGILVDVQITHVTTFLFLQAFAVQNW